MDDNVPRKIIALPAQAARDLRHRFGLKDCALRISYIGGPGDVVGTYAHWRAGKPDPRIPSVTYSAQLYELAHQLEVPLQVITGFPPPTEATPGVRFTQVVRQPWEGRLQYFRSQTRYRRDVVNAVDAFNPHVVITSLDFPSSGWAPLSRNRKLVVTAHNTFWPMGQKPTGLKAALKMMMLEQRSKALDGAVCTSQECARQISTITKGRINGRVEHPQIVARYKLQERQRMRQMLYLGRIERAKGVFMLLEAFATLKQRFPDLGLTFAGSGSCDEALHAAIKTTDLPDLQYLGQLDATGVHRAIAEADLIVCPTMSSFPEGLALVGLEAAAHGIPTLQSSIVPAVDLLGPACKTFRVDDGADLTRALSELITDDAQYKDLLKHIRQVRPKLYDASLSWGSQLARVLLYLKASP